MNFDEEYYKKTIEQFNYSPLDFAPMDFEFMGISKEVMKAKWLCHSGIDRINNNSYIITTGVGLSGIPHMGTLSQILRALYLQKNGVNVQIVLGDLDSYNARGKDISYVTELSKKYEDFILQLGFNSELGVLRNQIDYPKINQTAYFLSKYVSDKDFLDTEEDLSSLYIEKNVYKGITFPVKQAILLMISDFIELTNNYSDVVVMLGLEEHRYVLLARKILNAMCIDSNISAIYSRIIRGLNGYPKMSKSIKGSAISVDMTSQEIIKTIVNENDDFDIPDNSVVFQLIMSVSDYSTEELSIIYGECKEKGSSWISRKKEYAERLAKICSIWK